MDVLKLLKMKKIINYLIFFLCFSHFLMIFESVFHGYWMRRNIFDFLN